MVHKGAEKQAQPDKMPVLFLGHGSPLNIVLKNRFTEHLVTLGVELPRPRAIMVISAHWLTDGTFVACNQDPQTIYDFYGFPQELYRIKYPSPGSPELAKLVTATAQKDAIKCDNNWGLDHASWSVLKHMYPEADIPVFEMSLDYSFNDWRPRPLQYHFDLAAQLKELRKKGLLIIGSGNVVHNLRMIDFQNMDAAPYDWAVELDEKIKAALVSGQYRDLLEYHNMGRAAQLGIPTLDHYLPMIYTIALREKDEPLQFTYEGMQNGSISMRCFRIG
jgi:4,5-DOPA dioxygenase extradiol